METYVGNKIIEEQALDAVAQLKETDVSVAYSFAVRKGNSEAFQVFSEGLAYLKASGQLKKIQNKWLERRFLLTQRTLDSLVLYALAALLFLMACAMLKSGGNQSVAARLLGISQPAISKRLNS